MKTYELIPLAAPVTKTVAIPGSKSYTNRALLIAALTKGTVTLTNALDSDDTQAMLSCLQTLGLKIQQSNTTITIESDITVVKPQEYILDAKLSGTTIRFLTALACIIPGTKIITGAEGLKKRPIADLVDALRQLGATISYEEKEGYPPIRISSEKLTPGKVTMKGSSSSQYVSAMLLIAPCIGNIEINIEGDQISKPYIAMTVAIMKDFGVNIENHGYTSYKTNKSQSYKKDTYTIEGDYSSAGYFFAIAALTKSTITVTNLNPNSAQADKQFIALLEFMGNNVTYGQDSITIQGNSMKPLAVSLNDYPDQAQTLAVLSAFIPGKTTIEHIASLRIKETERIHALETELEKMGIKTESTNKSLTIYGGTPQPATIATYGDHRMAMAFAVAGAKISGMRIEDPDVVNKTFPTFLENTGADRRRSETSMNIIFIGMRGSGKSTIARKLSKALSRPYIEIDRLIVKEAGMTIPEMVAKYSWEYFREKEAEMTKHVCEQDNVIISTGGGVITKPENIVVLQKNSKIFYLRARLSTLLRRIGKDTNRPALTGQKSLADEIKEVLQNRKVLYETTANCIIDTDKKSVNTVVKEILTQL